MTDTEVITKRGHVELALDACLITAGLFALTTSFALGVVAIMSSVAVPDWLMVIGQLIGSLGLLFVAIGGPLLTWTLYGRKASAMAFLGAVLGAGAAGVLAGSGALLSIPLGWIVSPISTSEFAGAIALLVIVAAAFLGAVVWLLIDAVRDSMPERRAHRRLDIVRIASALAVLVFASASIYTQLVSPAGEMGEAFIFAMVFGIAGGLTVAGADLLVTLSERRAPTAPTVAG